MSEQKTTVANGLALMRKRLRSSLGPAVKSLYSWIVRWKYASRLGYTAKGEGPKGTLVIWTDAIGDFILFLPALGHLRRALPNETIVLLVGELVASLARESSSVDEVLICNVQRYRRDLFYRFRVIEMLRRRKFRIALYPAHSREPIGDEILCCCGAEKRIAQAGDLNNIRGPVKRKNNAYLTRIVPSSPGMIPEVERNREFVEQLTGRKLPAEESLPRITVTEGQMQNARQLLLCEGVKPNIEMQVVLFPGASNAIRAWPAKRFAELGDRIARTYGARILVCGSPFDLETEEAVAAGMSAPPVRLAGKTSLIQLAAVLRQSVLYIGSETGPLHLAAAVGTPTMCILGGGHFGRFYPYGDLRKHRAVFQKMDCYHCNWECIYEIPHCIRDITVEAAWETVERIFEEVILPAREAYKAHDAVLERSP
jgi:ADP-heptose:LPS heptosyltransferase